MFSLRCCGVIRLTCCYLYLIVALLQFRGGPYQFTRVSFGVVGLVKIICSADHSDLAVWGVYCLLPLKHWARGFESHSAVHGYMSAYISVFFFPSVGRGLTTGQSPVRGLLTINSFGFCLRRLFPNKNCMLAMCNTPFYSFRFPLSNLIGIFRLELMVRKFQDKNYGLSSWEKWTFPTPSSYEFNWNICAVYGEDSIAERTAQQWFARFKQGNFDMSDTPRSGRPCCASGGIWKRLSIMNAGVGPDPHCWTLLSTISPSGGSNSAETPLICFSQMLSIKAARNRAA
jgi:hypothetical protein